MKYFLLGFLMSFSALAVAQTYPRPYIISGFDDVLRQAENTGIFRATLKIFEKDKDFAGMSELYQIISSQESKAEKFSLVSGISHWFDERIDQFLTLNQYPKHARYLRNWVTEWSIEEFKMSKVEKIVSENRGRNFIVIFDNSGASLGLSEMLHEKYTDKIQDIYLRQVVPKKIPQGATHFLTAFDIALNEWKKDRLSMADASRVASAILEEKNPEIIIPSYAYCPKDYSPCSSAKSLEAICEEVRIKINKICSEREERP